MKQCEYDCWVRVSRMAFRKAFENGYKVCVMPCNMRIDESNPWCQPIIPSFTIIDLQRDYCRENKCKWTENLKFDILFRMKVNIALTDFFNEAIWYNCDSQRGKYLSYYVYKG